MDESNNDPIGEALNLPALEEQANKIVTQYEKVHNNSVLADFESARANIHMLLDTGQDAMEKLVEIAGASQHPRAYEVLAKLMDTVLNANKDLLYLQEKYREIKRSDAPLQDRAQTINNNLFVGSTAELQKVLKDIRKNERDTSESE